MKGPMHELTRQQARRIAVRAQLLDAERPTDMMHTIRHLTELQADPVKVIAPSADLVLWTRLGPSYDPAELEQALTSGQLIELRSRIRPAEDIALFRAEMREFPYVGKPRPWYDEIAEWLEANDETRREILQTLRGDGPLPASAFPDSTALPWRSSGWNNDRSIRMLLELMVMRGEIASLGWEGRERLWDLAERVYPDDPGPPLAEAFRRRGDRELASLGLDRTHVRTMQGVQTGIEPSGEAARIEGVRGTWRVHPAYLDGLDDFEGRCAILSPLDRLVFDRSRMEHIFEFDYQLEMFKPAAKRRWGYWAMPVLYGDRLVGKVDATADRDAGRLFVDAVHEDGRWTRAMRSAVDAELHSLASWLGVEPARA
jgi:uncharacterized protein YcaQ